MIRPLFRLRVWFPLKSHATDTFSACLGRTPTLVCPILLKLKSTRRIEIPALAGLAVMAFALFVVPLPESQHVVDSAGERGQQIIKSASTHSGVDIR